MTRELCEDPEIAPTKVTRYHLEWLYIGHVVRIPDACMPKSCFLAGYPRPIRNATPRGDWRDAILQGEVSDNLPTLVASIGRIDAKINKCIINACMYHSVFKGRNLTINMSDRCPRLMCYQYCSALWIGTLNTTVQAFETDQSL